MKYNYESIRNLFLRQSYLDSWEEYSRSLRKSSSIRWDYVVLTASNEEQAHSYQMQLDYRKRRNLLPSGVHYAVLPDYENKRVGSGGATFHVLRYIVEKEREIEGRLQGDNPFRDKRILVIHSGGYSKRVPQYSACGKLFAPVPRELPNGQASTLFDEFMIGMSAIPGRIKEGMLVLSGDVLLLFNPLQIDFSFQGAAAISFKESVKIGINHGVYVGNSNGNVELFLHKQDEKNLYALGAVNEKGNVDLDTGAVCLDSQLLLSLYRLISRPDGMLSEERFRKFVNEKARLNFYGDFLYPLAQHATKEQYFREEAEGEFCEELLECREELWNTLSKYNIKLFSLSPAEFIHFGTTHELVELVTQKVVNYKNLDWKRHVVTNREVFPDCAFHTCLLGPEIDMGSQCYVEFARLQGKTFLGDHSVVSNVDLIDAEVPSDTVMHGITFKDGSHVVRVYGIGDNPKDSWEDICRRHESGKKENDSLKSGSTVFSMEDAIAFLLCSGVKKEEIWPDGSDELWKAKIYPVCHTTNAAVKAALRLFSFVMEGCCHTDPFDREEFIAWWRGCRKTSLYESYNNADVSAMLSRKQRLEDEILVEKYIQQIRDGAGGMEAAECFGEEGIDSLRFTLIMTAAAKRPFSEKIRIYYDLSRFMKKERLKFDNTGYDYLEMLSFAEIRDTITENAISHILRSDNLKIRKDNADVRLPVRVNWGGGWTDTPPYCNEHGGVVLNAAISLKGKLPIHAIVRKMDELEVRFESVDVGAAGTAGSLEEIQNCSDPYDPFALHKAALIACGIIPQKGTGSLRELLKSFGGGICVTTEVEGVPKGSGLGTSSILSGACVKALSEMFGLDLTEKELYETVLCMEQLMSTGGGWQDQIGGLAEGIKMITTKPGIDQHFTVEKLELGEKVMQELQDRFALIYTGQRRLARNLLRDVVGGYLLSKEQSVNALARMKRVAVLMRFELTQENIDGFASLLNEHWELSKQLDAGSTNTCIDQIFLACDDLIDGKFISGAGGGGFLQVILKKGVTKQQLSERLKDVFEDSGVDVWPCEFV